MSLFLEEREKKALVRLQLVNKETNEVESELGFATKICVPDKQDPEETNVLLITSPSIFPDNIDARLNDIVVHRCVARPWLSRKFKQENPAKVKNIENHKEADVSTVVFEGDKKNSLPYEVLTDNKKKKHKKLSACVFEDKKLIEFQFANKGGSYKLINVSKEGFDVKKAKGAPVIIGEITHYYMDVFPRGYRKIVGVLSINNNGDLYPVLFKDGFLDVRPSSSDIAEAGPSGIDMKQSDVRPSSSDIAEAGPSGIDKKQSDERAGSSSGDVGPSTTYHQQPARSKSIEYVQDYQFKVAVLVVVAGFVLYGCTHYGPSALVIDSIGALFIYLTYLAYMSYYIHNCSQALKSSIKQGTESLPKMLSNDITSAKTDDIFTNLTVYYGDKEQVKKEQEKGLSRREQLQEYTKRTAGFKVKKYEDIFIDKKRENPKTLLLTGKPGIGKTMFCEKIIRDWSMDRLFQNEDTPNIKFAYLLKFRQLSSHGDKELNLHELLNCSPLLDDNSVIDDSLFEYLTKNPSEVLIILDGFDEYSEQHRKQIASDFEQQYSNDSTKKMPIPALCSKLIRGKVLKNSVVLVSSRPGEAEKLGEINVDRYVEISGFSPEQVTEYVDKYFSEPEKEQTKNTVREHVEKNENLVSFCHIPLLSFLLCWCLEWRITQSGITKNLPAKITDLYDEVVNVVVQKVHANLKYSKMSGNTMKVTQETLDKLGELAANLLKESKYIFDEEDMKKLNLTQDEIENLKVSGILHCVPGIRISAFRTKAEFSFIHLTLQEYLSASFFVKNKEIPDKHQVSGQTLVFMSGCLREKDVKLMEKLIQQITPKDYTNNVNKLLMLQCLYEYGDDKLTKLTINNLYDKYCDSYGRIGFNLVTDFDMKYISYVLDVINLLKEQHPHSSSGYILHISNSPLITSFGVGVMCVSLVRNSFITGLMLGACSLDDKCVEKITDSLVNTGITNLDLNTNNITDKGVESIRRVLTETKISHLKLWYNIMTDKGAESICRVIIQDDCHVEELVLTGNEKITAECKKRVKQLVQKHKPGVILGI